MRDLDRALADIVAIRMQIARDTAFRGLGAATLAATGGPETLPSGAVAGRSGHLRRRRTGQRARGRGAAPQAFSFAVLQFRSSAAPGRGRAPATLKN